MINVDNFDPWITCFRPNPNAYLRLFCFPYAGRGTSIFRTWSNILPIEVEICPVQLPGRENRIGEPPFTQLSLLVEKLAQVFLPYLNKPFALFGHSMGALISFELAHYLRRHNSGVPTHLFVSGCKAPQVSKATSSIHTLSDIDFVEHLRRLSGTPELVIENAELMQLLLPLLRADFALCETYTYISETRLGCPISTFGGLQDYEISRKDLELWGDLTQSNFTLYMLQGDHFFLNSNRMQLLRILSRDIAQIVSNITKS